MGDEATNDSRHRAHGLGFWQRVGLAMLAALIRGWTATLRWRMDPATRAVLEESPVPEVVVLWHNRLFLTPELHRRSRTRGRPMAALISASRDGAWIAGLLGRLGVISARGSSSRRSLTAIRELQRLLEDGHDVTITPDGPRGPCYQFKVGPVFLARLARVPVVLVNAEFSRSWRLRSWDRFFLPRPFSTVLLRAERITDLADREWESNEAAAAWLGARLRALGPD